MARPGLTILTPMAKDTEKLIRQLSLISFLMAQGRPVSALEIKREVEGYSDMNEDAFARRFYADRAELESLGIVLQVEKPGEGFFEAELYALPPENYYLPAIEFADGELAALQTALSLLDGRFAYAEPLRLALQQVSWGRPSPLGASEPRSVEISMTASAGGRELSQRLSKVETAISRRKTIEFTYYTMQRDEEAKRRVNPYHLVYKGGQFYLIGHSHERDDVRVFRLSRIRGKVSYATKAEHDFNPPESFERRDYAHRADWQMGETEGRAKIFLRERIAWLIERDFGEYGDVRTAKAADGASGKGKVFETDYASTRELVSWILRWRRNAAILEPRELADEVDRRLELLEQRHRDDFEIAAPVKPTRAPAARASRSNGKAENAIRPERFARLVTLAGFLIDAAKRGERLSIPDLCERLNLSPTELREDIDVLNVVNFGGGTYVLYAEIQGDEIEVDSEPYGDNFSRPARLLPLEAKALVAAIDLFGDHLPQSGLQSSRKKIVAALGHDPAEEGLEIAPSGDDSEVARIVNRAILERRILELDYYKENEDQFTKREVEPYRLENGREGWYVEVFDPKPDAIRHFKLDRIREAKVSERSFEPRPEVVEQAALEGWLTDGEVPTANVARVWVSPERARWVREERNVIEELADGAVIVEVPYAGSSWLIREILSGAGDLVVLKPADAREAILGEVGAVEQANAA
ncbi:MAG: proteasome accessory factor [Solirubrobacterales bacterium]|nr:proteasome accessory factor [Solirubrobacterales bacterium]